MIAIWAHGLVRARWWLLAGWAAVGALAVARAGGVAERLDVRGGSLRVTEASRVDELLATRFRQDIGETFLVLVSGPEAVTGARPRRLLDALCSALAREWRELACALAGSEAFSETDPAPACVGADGRSPLLAGWAARWSKME